MSSFSILAAFVALTSRVFAAPPIPNVIGLSVTGSLDSCSVDTTDYNSGGFITVDYWSIQVPKNLLVQFPTIFSPFSQLCTAGATGYEVSVLGNVVNGQAVAGQIFMSAGFSLRAGQGYIESMDTVDGSFKIRGGPTLRLNDPNGVFGKASNLAPFYPVDDQNPSITAFSGFPMCIPRSSSDAKCPQSNRPTTGNVFAAPDPLSMVPLRVGDFITYAGQKGIGEILVYAATAIDVQVTTTASSSVPNYIRVEDVIIGVFDPDPNVEVADIRFIGYLSSCSSVTVVIYAADIDPCTGQEVLRQVASAVPTPGDPRCRWEARLTSTTVQQPYTREYMIKTTNAVITTKDGIQAGQYLSPVTEWIQPEVAIPGAEQGAYRFQDIRGLVQGDFEDGLQYGQLSPFPNPNPPAPSAVCLTPPSSTPVPSNAAATTPPTLLSSSAPVDNNPFAVATAAASSVRCGVQVSMFASNKNTNVPATDLAYTWSQLAPTSPSVSIANAAAPTASVIGPKAAVDVTYIFEVTEIRKSDSTLRSKANVTILFSPNAPDAVTLDTFSWLSRNGGTIGVSCSSNVINGDNKLISLVMNTGGKITTVSMANTGPGKWNFSSTNVKQPTSVQCVSDLGGKSDVVTAPRRRRRDVSFTSSDGSMLPGSDVIAKA